jgi:hypothetical protein
MMYGDGCWLTEKEVIIDFYHPECFSKNEKKSA